MFDQNQPQPVYPREPTSYVGTRILVVGGIGLLLAFGLCGASAVGGRFSSAGTFAAIGAGLFVLAMLTLVIGAIVLVIELIARR